MTSAEIDTAISIGMNTKDAPYSTDLSHACAVSARIGMTLIPLQGRNDGDPPIAWIAGPLSPTWPDCDPLDLPEDDHPPIPKTAWAVAGTLPRAICLSALRMAKLGLIKCPCGHTNCGHLEWASYQRP